MGTPTKTVIPAAVSKSDEVLDPRTSTAGGVRLRGVTVALDTEVGQQFIVDCARNIEGQMPDNEIKNQI